MAGDDLTIQGAIKFILDRVGLQNAQAELKKVSKGADEAAPALKKVGKAAKDTTLGFDPMATSIKQVRSLLLRTFGAGALIALTKTAVDEFKRISESINGIEVQLRLLGIAADANLPKLTQSVLFVTRYGAGLAEAGEQMRSALATTKDATLATGALGMAARLADIGVGKLAENQELMSRVVRGDLGAAVAAFNIDLKDGNGALKTQAQLIEDVIDQMRIARTESERGKGVAGALSPAGGNDTQSEIASRRAAAIRAGAEAEEAAFAAYVSRLRELALAADKEKEDAWVKAYEESEAARHAQAYIEEQRAAEARIDVWSAYNEELTDQDNRRREEYQEAQTEARQQEIQDAEQLAALKSDQRVREMQADLEASATERDRVESAIDAERALLEMRLSSTNMELDARVALEHELARMDRDRLLRVSKTAREQLAIIKKYLEDEVGIAKRTAKTKNELNLLVAQKSVELASAVFGENKIVSIAQSIVDTIMAVQNVMSDPGIPYPYNLVLAAIVGAIGAANTAKIVATEPKSTGTFDTPVNDQIARVGTKKSAEDFVRLSQQGIGEGLSAAFGMPSAATATPALEGASSRTVNITINGYAHLQDLRRALELADRRDLSRIHR